MLTRAAASAELLVLAMSMVGCEVDPSPSEVHVVDISAPMNLYESGATSAARRAVESAALSREEKDLLLLKVLVADGVAGRNVPPSELRRVLEHVSKAPETSILANRYLLATGYSQAGDRRRAIAELLRICPAGDRSQMNCHETGFRLMRQNAMLLTDHLHSRLLRASATLVKEEFGAGPEIDASLVYGLYFDEPAESAKLLRSLPQQGPVLEAYCSGVFADASASPAAKRDCSKAMSASGRKQTSDSSNPCFLLPQQSRPAVGGPGDWAEVPELT